MAEEGEGGAMYAGNRINSFLAVMSCTLLMLLYTAILSLLHTAKVLLEIMSESSHDTARVLP